MGQFRCTKNIRRVDKKVTAVKIGEDARCSLHTARMRLEIETTLVIDNMKRESAGQQDFVDLQWAQ